MLIFSFYIKAMIEPAFTSSRRNFFIYPSFSAD